MLRHRLARPKAAGDRGRAALGDREQRIDDALPGDERPIDRQAARHGTRLTDRPELRKRKRMRLPFVVPQRQQRFAGRIRAVRPDIHGRPGKPRRHHCAVLNDRRFGTNRENLAACQPVALPDAHGNVPFFLHIERRQIAARRDERAVCGGDFAQRAFDAVKDV